MDSYRKLGFNHIFIYDNNDINDEKIEVVVSNEVKNGFVSIINFRGYRGGYGGPQMAAYYDCYEKNNLFYDWISFFDVDEYLVLNPENITIQKFLNYSQFDNCEIIKINWKLFSDNNLLDFEDKPLNERFKQEYNSSDILNIVAKTIVRTKLYNYSSRKSYNPHTIFYSNYSCDSNGKVSLGYNVKPPEYKNAYLCHYMFKTIKEYIIKKKKGDSFYQNYKINKKTIRYLFNYYFQYNKKTKEKVAIFNKEFNSTFQ